MSDRQQRDSDHGWCSLRLRFQAHELTLLKGAEQLRGHALARSPRADQLRAALSLAKAGHKLGRGLGPGEAGMSVSLDEGEVKVVIDAVRYAIGEVRWLSRAGDAPETLRRRDAILQAFPELTDRGLWRSFALTRELEDLAARLEGAVSGTP